MVDKMRPQSQAISQDEFEKALNSDGVQYLSVPDVRRHLLPYLSKAPNNSLIMTVHTDESEEFYLTIKAEVTVTDGQKRLIFTVDEIYSEKLEKSLENKKIRFFSSKYGRRHARARVAHTERSNNGELTLKQLAILLGVETNSINFAVFKDYSDEDKEESAASPHTDKKVTKKTKNKRKAPRRRKKTTREKKEQQRREQERLFKEGRREIDRIDEWLKGQLPRSSLGARATIRDLPNPGEVLSTFLQRLSFLPNKTIANLLARYVVDSNKIDLARFIVEIGSVLQEAVCSMKIPKAGRSHDINVILTFTSAVKRYLGIKSFVDKDWRSVGYWEDERSVERYAYVLGLEESDIQLIEQMSNRDIVIDLGAGLSVLKENSFLQVVREINPEVQILAVDPAYSEEKAPIAASKGVAQCIQKGQDELRGMNIGTKALYAHELSSALNDGSVTMLVSVWALDKIDVKNKIFKTSMLEIYKVLKPGALAIVSPVTKGMKSKIDSIFRDFDDVDLSYREINVEGNRPDEEHYILRLHKKK